MAVDDALMKRLVKSLLQASVILLAGTVIGLAFNSLRHDRLPWTGDFSPPEVEAKILTVGVMEAWRDYQKGLVQFVDARSPSEYAAGHLPGAMNVPAEGAESRAGRMGIPEGREIVVYCSDPSCTKGGQLAAMLFTRGVKGLAVMPEGWAGWYEQGLPCEGKGEG